ncbi:hypothetical protein PLEOSDRAFT_1095043 [Pleurotus ostreatus PC15]|uniref:F-actin-capping protein subunit alpha n=1 Tax=Pleurotus ostreatus (strain PC15) TaxID=1137138 RepID=A0A067NFX8_PLEO1|nr:hypothetical protein PLEOSDRAFT_1095043 [Pleurotus ostreatus PC15]
MDSSERIQIASNFLLQSPPGEINDVLNDVRVIISDDESLQEGVLPALREYNLAQFIVADVPGTKHQSIVSTAARAPPSESDSEASKDRFLDPRSKTSFAFDHITLEASDPQTYEPDAESEPLRGALESSTLSYLAAHYLEGVGCVYAVPDSSDMVIQIVANKYNPTNYWSGRWRSEYKVAVQAGTLSGRILANVHYYEQGNVQLASEHNVEITLPTGSRPPADLASKVLALIADEEGKYQTTLNDTYQEMGEKTFKALRRALPLTRQKIDWDKVLGYKLGAELASNKAGFAS